MDRRREKKLCFEYGLLGHRANSYYKGGAGKPWKGKRKQAAVMTRQGAYDTTGVKQLCVMYKGKAKASKAKQV
jgi:hypothetical protein